MSDHKTERQSLDLLMSRIKREIEDETAAREQPATQATATTPGMMDKGAPATMRRAASAESPSPSLGQERYALSDLLNRDDEDFLANAYRVILRRELDSSGRVRFLAPLRDGRLSKTEMLARLRYSKEGRQQKSKIRGGLLFRGLAARAMRVRVIGYPLRLIKALAQLPAHVRRLGEVRDALEQLSSTTVRASDFWNAIEQKVDKTIYEDHSNQESARFWEVVNAKVDKTAYTDHLVQHSSRLADLTSDVDQLRKLQQEQKTHLIDLQRRVYLMVDEVRKRLPEPLSGDQLETLSAYGDHLFDAYYASFEDEFRGTRNDIKQRAAIYPSLIRNAQAGTQERLVLDIGCGRGELLEVLQEEKLHATGIDINEVNIAACISRNLSVTRADALSYLLSLSDNSLGAVTGLHIIEHLPFETLVRLLDEVVRVLKPGGLAAFESPNPENLLVGACRFYYDPTHRNPLPPAVAQFMLEARGFVRADIIRLNEYRQTERLPDPDPASSSAELERITNFLNQHFAAAPDYAVVGYKA